MKPKYYLIGGLFAIVLAAVAMLTTYGNRTTGVEIDPEMPGNRIRLDQSEANRAILSQKTETTRPTLPVNRHLDPIRDRENEVWQHEMSQLVAQKLSIESEIATVSRLPSGRSKGGRLDELTKELAEISDGIAAVESAMQLDQPDQ